MVGGRAVRVSCAPLFPLMGVVVGSPWLNSSAALVNG